MTDSALPARERQVLDRVLAAALRAVDPAAGVLANLLYEDDALVVHGRAFPVADLRRVLVVGAGKASAPMVAAVEEVVAPTGLPIEGVVNVRYGHTAPGVRQVHIREAGHPIPDQAGVSGSSEIAALLEDSGKDDLVICVISGGGSALLTLPAEGISLDDLQATTDLLLRAGATIGEMNAVRKHLDRLKGGGLAALAAPASVVALVLSDVVGNPLDVIASGPTVLDSSTWADVAAAFDRYVLWDQVPPSVAERVRSGMRGDLPDTRKPGDPAFERVHTVLVGSNLVACRAAVAEAERLGLRSLLLTTFVEGEAREVGRVLAGFLREVHQGGHPLPRPCCLVAGGETTVTVRGKGKGGRNQEVALAAALALQGVPGVLFASIGTDGSDGPTDAAGAWVDGTTIERATSAGLDPARHLVENDAYPFFNRIGGLVTTGPTYTNVNDLYLLFAF